MKKGYVYILTNPRKTVLYTGVTSNLGKRLYEHKNKIAEGFTRRYNCSELVYYEISDDIESAIAREKQIKAGCRLKKEELINNFNPEWEDLSKGLFGF